MPDFTNFSEFTPILGLELCGFCVKFDSWGYIIKIIKLEAGYYSIEGHPRIAMRRSRVGGKEYIWELLLDNKVVRDFPIFSIRRSIVNEVLMVGLRNIYKEGLK